MSTNSVNARSAHLIHAVALISAAIYLLLALGGDLRDRIPAVLIAHGLLLAGMLLAWQRMRRGEVSLRTILLAALLFRLLAAWGEPMLSDDVYRYVWDGRVQLHGVHPYAHAPDDPALAELRDADWAKINHPELRTIYPPLAQILFALLAAPGGGTTIFQLGLGLLDFGVVLALVALLRRLGVPGDRVVLYAWNPLAVIEGAGSGHVEPLGVLLLMLAALALVDRKPGRAVWALAGAVQAKLLPLVLVPGAIRRLRGRWVLLLLLLLAAPFLLLAWGGPPVGSGLFDYAERWEGNAVLFPLIQGGLEAVDSGNALEPTITRIKSTRWLASLPWETIYRWAWPAGLARLIVGGLALAWLLMLSFRRGLDVTREFFLGLAGVLLLSPTLHPWYVLWLLPFAAAYRSWPWLAFAALLPLSYLGGGLPSWALRGVEYLPLLVGATFGARRLIQAR